MRQTVFITGGSSGIGRAMVLLFLKEGYNVANLSLHHHDDEPKNENYIALTGDICDEAVRQSAVKTITEKFGNIDILINNAAVGYYSNVYQSEPEKIRRMFDVNFFAQIELTKLIVPQMLNSGRNCSIVNFGSVGGYVSLPWAPFYCASKFAMHAFNDSLRRELSKTKIHVMKICPGIVESNFRDNVLGGHAPGNVKKIRKIVTAEQVAQTIFKGIKNKKAEAYIPFLARIFVKLEQLCPWLMDQYIERKKGGF